MDPSLLCRVFFTIGTVVSLAGNFVPCFKDRFMEYGSRRPIQNSTRKSTSESCLKSLFIRIATLQVPHSWFTHYYVASVASSIFWLFQIWTRGPALRVLASYSEARATRMSERQVFLALFLMAIQGVRRLSESLLFTRPTQSKMWIGLWVLGTAFYIFLGISVWIEGIGALSEPPALTHLLEVSKPTAKAIIAVPIFAIASAIQHICHKHLASLKKYSLPRHKFFHTVVCPHYTCECFIYFAIAIVSAPEGQILNLTVLSASSFVVSNLAVTANSSQRWYVEKFGAEIFKHRWRMIPCIF